jgi:hypothetical protein
MFKRAPLSPMYVFMYSLITHNPSQIYIKTEVL